MMPKGKTQLPRGDLKCLWGHQMFGLYIFVYIECDFFHSYIKDPL